MPKVGDKHFGYDPAGVKAAEQESAATGVPMVKTQNYATGGLVKSGGTTTRGQKPIQRVVSKHRNV